MGIIQSDAVFFFFFVFFSVLPQVGHLDLIQRHHDCDWVIVRVLGTSSHGCSRMVYEGHPSHALDPQPSPTEEPVGKRIPLIGYGGGVVVAGYILALAGHHGFRGPPVRYHAPNAHFVVLLGATVRSRLFCIVPIDSFIPNTSVYTDHLRNT